MLRISLAIACLLGAASNVALAAAKKPNILFIILDDQNAFALRHDLAPEPVTPNLDKLEKRGVTFVHAQCAAPVCNPSRAALFSGMRPSSSGVYDNDQGRLRKGSRLESAVALPEYFRQQGYTIAGGGKIFSASLGSLFGKNAWDVNPPSSIRTKGHDVRPPKDKIPLNGIGKHDWGSVTNNKDEMDDWQLAGWAADFLAEEHSQPFFLGCGIVKPHTPWYVPQEYFDLFPPESITIADLTDHEGEGVPKIAREKHHPGDDELIRRRKELIAAYLASSRYADDCVGRVLDGLKKGPHRDNTIVIVCGDNGYQFGEKNSWSKGKLWEGSTHVPLVMAGPGIAKGETCEHAVSLMDVYPTLVALAGLPRSKVAEGASLVPLLENASAEWDHPAITTKGFKNHAVRDDRWRYISYSDGSEELYDYKTDPLERTDLAHRPESAPTIKRLRKYLPKHDESRADSEAGSKDD